MIADMGRADPLGGLVNNEDASEESSALDGGAIVAEGGPSGSGGEPADPAPTGPVVNEPPPTTTAQATEMQIGAEPLQHVGLIGNPGFATAAIPITYTLPAPIAPVAPRKVCPTCGLMNCKAAGRTKPELIVK
jgi:hypothetical protein